MKVAATRHCWHYLIVMNASFESIDQLGRTVSSIFEGWIKLQEWVDGITDAGG